jgi:hypothetical protein
MEENSKYAQEIALIRALVPFLREEKKGMADKIIKILRMMEMMEQDV